MTTKFFCKTDFDMKEIQKEEAGYVPLPKFYTFPFPSREERERILYKNFVQSALTVSTTHLYNAYQGGTFALWTTAKP